MDKMRVIVVASFLISVEAFAQTPTTDPTIDWLMGQAATAPSSQPTTQPSRVLKSEDGESGRPGVLELSDGRKIRGILTTTSEKPLRVWIEEKKEYQDIPYPLIQSIQATVLWERDEPEWRFAATGSDVKEYSGKTYPARETSYKLTLTNGQIIQGGVVAPLVMTTSAGTETFILHKRDKGMAGQSLNQLVYVKQVLFDESGSDTK